MFLHFSMLAGYHLVPGFHLHINPLYLGLVCFVTGVIVFVIILVFHHFYKPHVRPQLQVNDGLPHPACIGLDPFVIETFPMFKYSEVAAHRDGTGPMECSVCLSPFEADGILRLLPKCNHIFHVSCLDPWLKDHDTCPLCRACLVPEPGELTLVDVGWVDDLGREVSLERDVEEGVFGKHKRWNSTGHVVVVDLAEMKSWERFTLRLPEEDVGIFGVKTGEFRRTRSSI